MLDISKIHQENVRILYRLKDKKSNYSFDSFRSKRKEEKKLLSNISLFPFILDGSKSEIKRTKMIPRSISSIARQLVIREFTPFKNKRQQKQRCKTSQGQRIYKKANAASLINMTEQINNR
jgi:hypothetical protein